MESDDFDCNLLAPVGGLLHQLVDLLEADLALGELADLGVLAHEDAAAGVQRSVAPPGVNKDAVEAGHGLQPGHLATAEVVVPGHAGILRRGDVHCDLIGALGDCGLAGNLPLLDVQQRVGLLQAPVAVLQGVAVVDAVDVQAADRVGDLGPPAFHLNLHRAAPPPSQR